MLFAAFWSAVNRGLRPRGTLYFLVSKVARKPRRCRGSFVPFFRKKYRSQSATGGSFAAFWSAKSGAKTDPPTKKAKRRGLTLAPGDYSRVCKQTVPSARAFSPHLFERLFCQAGVVRRETRREKSAFSLAAEKEQPTARVPGAGGCIVLFLLHPLNAGRRLFPRKATCGWFWRYLLTPKGSYTPRRPPRFCLPDGQKAPTVPAVRTARRQAIRKKNLALRPPCTIFGSALYRRRLGKLQTSLHLRPSCTIFVFIL